MHHYNTPNTPTYVSSENLHTEFEAKEAKTGKRKLGPGATRVPPRAHRCSMGRSRAGTGAGTGA